MFMNHPMHTTYECNHPHQQGPKFFLLCNSSTKMESFRCQTFYHQDIGIWRIRYGTEKTLLLELGVVVADKVVLYDNVIQLFRIAMNYVNPKICLCRKKFSTAFNTLTYAFFQISHIPCLGGLAIIVTILFPR